MATTYKVTINMPGDTAAQLLKDGLYLYGFKAVGTAIKGGAPLVWFKTQAYGAATTITWEEQYMAFTSTSDIQSNVTIEGINALKIDLGQEFLVTSPIGEGKVVGGPDPHSIAVTNPTNASNLICGISQVVTGNSTPVPLCALPLITHSTDLMEPVEIVAFMFATDAYNNGAAIMEAFSDGVTLDLTGAPGNAGSITYDLDNGGWAKDGSVTTTHIGLNDSLIPLLIQPSAAQKAEAKKMLADKKA